MTRSQQIESITSTVFLVMILAAVYIPGVSGLAWIALAVMLIGLGVAHRASVPADRERRRKAAWLVPAVTVAMAAQLIYFATAEERPRMLLVGGALVIVGIWIYVVRRRAD